MSAKSIVQEVLGKLSKAKSAKAIVQDALGQAGFAHEEHQEDGNPHEESQLKLQAVQQGDQKVITFSFTLDPQMVEELGKAMPKGAKPDDRADSLDAGGGDDSSQHQDPEEAIAGQPGERKDDSGNTTPEEQQADDKSSDGQKPNETVSELTKENDSDDSRDDDDDEESRDGSVDDDDPQATPTAQDEAIACDGRHTDTPIENCRAEDPMFCPYHGAKRMEQMISDEIKKVMGVDPATKGIKIGVSKAGSEFTATATYPSSMSLADQQKIEHSIWSFMRTPGLKNNTTRPVSSNNYNQTVPDTTTAGFSTESLKERLPQTATPADYDVAKAKQDMGIFNEWMDDLIEDFGDPKTDIDPTDLENLMNQQIELENLVNQAASGNPQATSQYKAAKKDFEEFYHDVRGVADLPQVQTVQDAEKMRDDLAGDRHKAGDWWNAKEEITDIRKQLGLLTSNGRALPMKTILTKYPSLFASWDKYKTKYENLFMGSLEKILGNGKTNLGAKGKFEDGHQNGDLRKMKGALHTLKYATEEYCDLMPAFMKAMQDHKGELLQYAQQKGVSITPYVPKQAPAPQQGQQQQQTQTTPGATGASQTSSASMPSVQSIQAALNGVPANLNAKVLKNQYGEHLVEFAGGNSNYVQSLIPSLQKQFPNSTVSLVSGSPNNNGSDYIKIV